MNSRSSQAVMEEQVVGKGQVSQAASWPPDAEQASAPPPPRPHPTTVILAT